MTDLFTGPHTARTAPDTSRVAARRIAPRLPAIREQVLAYALAAGPTGFTDEQIINRLEHVPVNSLRPRRCELADENRLIDSGRREKNGAGNDCVVWLHRDFAADPPPIVERATGPAWMVAKERAAVVRFVGAEANAWMGPDGMAQRIRDGAHLPQI